MITLAKSTPTYAVTVRDYLVVEGPAIKVGSELVTIKVRKITGKATRVSYPVPSHMIVTVAKIDCDLYR